MKVNTSGKLYKFNRMFNTENEIKGLYDSCAYNSMTIKSCVYALLCVVAIWLLSTGVGYMWIDDGSTLNICLVTIIGALSCVAIIVVTLAVLFTFYIAESKLSEWWSEWRGRRELAKQLLDEAKDTQLEDYEPCAIRQWYDQMKNKYCTKLEFTE